MRHSFGDTSGTASQFYAPMSGSTQRCVGCHVITHDGTKMARHLRRRQRRRRHRDGAEPGHAPARDQRRQVELRQLRARRQPHGRRRQGALKISTARAAPPTAPCCRRSPTARPATTARIPTGRPTAASIVYVSVGGARRHQRVERSAGLDRRRQRHGQGMFGNPTDDRAVGGREQLLPVVLARRKVDPLQPRQRPRLQRRDGRGLRGVDRRQ